MTYGIGGAKEDHKTDWEKPIPRKSFEPCAFQISRCGNHTVKCCGHLGTQCHVLGENGKRVEIKCCTVNIFPTTEVKLNYFWFFIVCPNGNCINWNCPLMILEVMFVSVCL